MQFRTKITIPISEQPIDYSSRIVTLGSCFAVNIAEKLEYYKFLNSVNPHGILFHPVALENYVSAAVNKKKFSEQDLFFNEGRWHCFDAHSDVSDSNKDAVLQKLNNPSVDFSETSHLIITLGTAWVYRNVDSGCIVANCHKVPQKQFTKELLSVESIAKSLQNIIRVVREKNSSIKIIFTVSPVRHIKDGFVENQISKSHLITGLHEVVRNTNSASYFPSYEIMMDELRDYRFFAADMIHPNHTAIDYIWQRFTETYLTADALSVMREVEGIQRAISHRPFSPDTDSHKAFLKNVARKISELQKRHPHIAF